MAKLQTTRMIVPFQLLFLMLFFTASDILFAQEVERCDWDAEIVATHISDLEVEKVLQKNTKYGFRFILASSTKAIKDTAENYCRSAYFLHDTNSDSAYSLSYTFSDYRDKYLKKTWNRPPSIFSPDGEYTAIKFHVFGGIPVIATRKLHQYLSGQADAELCIDQYRPGFGPPPHHKVKGWKNNSKLIFTWSCCGSIFLGEYDIKRKTTKTLKAVHQVND